MSPTAFHSAAIGRDEALLEQFPIMLVPIADLYPADSPRLAGEDVRHVRLMADSESALPPIVVHRPTMRVIDGMHRLRAAEQRGERQIAARFVDGSAEGAFVLAVQLNATHGRPLSHADRAAATTRLISTHPQWSDRRIAESAGVASSVVASLRSCATGRDVQSSTRGGRDGRARPLDAVEGRRQASRYIAEHPHASLRQIAGAAGVSVSTARDVRERPVTTGDTSASNMSRDPSLRLTEAGRMLLRLLNQQMVSADKWQWLAANVPGHRAGEVSRVAYRCAEQWRIFAETLEQRQAEER